MTMEQHLRIPTTRSGESIMLSEPDRYGIFKEQGGKEKLHAAAYGASILLNGPLEIIPNDIIIRPIS